MGSMVSMLLCSTRSDLFPTRIRGTLDAPTTHSIVLTLINNIKCQFNRCNSGIYMLWKRALFFLCFLFSIFLPRKAAVTHFSVKIQKGENKADVKCCTAAHREAFVRHFPPCDYWSSLRMLVENFHSWPPATEKDFPMGWSCVRSWLCCNMLVHKWRKRHPLRPHISKLSWQRKLWTIFTQVHTCCPCLCSQ